MFSTQDQISSAAKANLEAQFALYASLTAKSLDSIGKLINLNLTAARASMEESSATARQMLAAKDPQELIALVNAQGKPTLEKALAYGSHVANIANSTQTEFTKAVEQQIAEISRKVNELVETAVKNTPGGSESLAAIFKSAIDNANAGYEQLSRTGRQAAEAMEANLNSAVAQFAQGANAAPAAAKS